MEYKRNTQHLKFNRAEIIHSLSSTLVLARVEHGGSPASSPHVVVFPFPGRSSTRFSPLPFRRHYYSAILVCSVGSSWCAQLWQKIDPFSVSSPCLFPPEAKIQGSTHELNGPHSRRKHTASQRDSLLFLTFIPRKLPFGRIGGRWNLNPFVPSHPKTYEQTLPFILPFSFFLP